MQTKIRKKAFHFTLFLFSRFVSAQRQKWLKTRFKKICNRILSDTHLHGIIVVAFVWINEKKPRENGSLDTVCVNHSSTMVYTRTPPSQQYSANQLLRSSIVSTKGLLNGPGQNNCFLNCAVQVRFFQSIIDGPLFSISILGHGFVFIE